MAGSIEQRLTALEQLVQSLGGSEASQPNYLTLDAQGRVSANFSGVVSASGLILPAGDLNAGGPNAKNEIVWKRASDGAVTAFIYGRGDNNGLTDGLQLTGQGLAGNTSSYVIADATNDGTSGAARIEAVWNKAPGVSKVDGFADSQHFTIMDGAGNSTFLQTFNRTLRIAMGSVNIGSAATAVINHGLVDSNNNPITPLFVLTANAWADGTSDAHYTTFGVTSTQFSAVNKGPTSGSCVWAVLG